MDGAKPDFYFSMLSSGKRNMNRLSIIQIFADQQLKVQYMESKPWQITRDNMIICFLKCMSFLTYQLSFRVLHDETREDFAAMSHSNSSRRIDNCSTGIARLGG